MKNSLVYDLMNFAYNESPYSTMRITTNRLCPHCMCEFVILVDQDHNICQGCGVMNNHSQAPDGERPS